MEAITKYREVVIPDAIASGKAGTGCDYLSAAGTVGICTSGTGRWSRGTAGPGAPGPGVRTPRAAGRHEPEENPGAWYGDPAFPLTGGLEPISVWLDKKIHRQGRRLMRVEGRGEWP
jgi:hypothetical protein